MILAAAFVLLAASMFAAVCIRGWPTVSVSDGASGGDDEPIERAAAIGFGFQIPEPDIDDDEL